LRVISAGPQEQTSGGDWRPFGRRKAFSFVPFSWAAVKAENNQYPVDKTAQMMLVNFG
jgi:hypothetical protein